jgi:hypothetical protein
MKLVKLGQDFSYIRDSFQQLRGWSMLVIGSHVVLRFCWCGIIFLNVHPLREDKIDHTNFSFCEGLENVVDQAPKYHRKFCYGKRKVKLSLCLSN